jgi:hypothetical protein
VTIPSCRECNIKKGASGLPEFLLSTHFAKVRGKERPNRWSLRDLWLVMALAAVEQAREHAHAWPAHPPAKAKIKDKPPAKSATASD